MAPRLRPSRLLLAPLLLGAAAAVAPGPGAADDAVALLQLPTAGVPSLEAGDEVEVEAIEGVPGSLVPGTVTSSGALPGTYNVAVWDAPPEHRFMTDVAAESIQLRKAHRSSLAPPAVSPQAGDQDLFAALDTDRDGGISRSELAQAVVRLVGSAPAGAAAAPGLITVPAAPPPAAATLVAAPLPAARASAEAEAAAKPAAAPPAPAALPAGKDCWVGGYSRDACCDLYWGPGGDENCWDGFFTFQRCCKPDQQVVQEAQRYAEDAAARKAALEEERRAQEKQKEEEKRRKEEEDAQRQGEQRTSEEKRERQRKAEAEARERYDAELRRRAREEDRKIAREQAQKRADDQAKSKASIEAKRKAEEAEHLAWEQKACPEGFQYLVGDVPGFDQFGHDDKLKRKSVELCGKECAKNALCQSFEWSPTKTQCNLNKVSDPKTSVKYMDFVFCRRLKKA